MLFLRSLWKNKYFLVLTTVMLALASKVWTPSPLIAALPQKGFIDYTELMIPFLMILPISFLLYDNFEIELALTCGIKTTRLMMNKFISLFIYSVVPLFLLVGLYKYTEFIPNTQTKIKIPIHVPENYKIYMLISAFVTVVFFASLFLFARVATKNCYAPVGLGILAYSIFSTLNTNIHGGYDDIRKCIFDPFLSNYFMGDTVLTEYYRVGPLWTYNRLLFFGIAVVLLVATYFLLRKEKLHQGFND